MTQPNRPTASFSRKTRRQFLQGAGAALSAVALASCRGGYSNVQGGAGGGDTVRIYLYAVSRQQTEQVIQTLNLPVEVVKDVDSADVILALRSQVRSQAKLRNLAEARNLPIHTLKASTLHHITRALRRLLNMDESPSGNDLQLFAYGDSEDEMEALEEARLAVEQIVIPKGQAVELLPRSSFIRRMQHELVEHYQLRSDSFGDEPNRRLRIYPN